VITAIDSNVVLDILGADPVHGPGSLRAIGDAQELGVVMACDQVWAEVGANYRDPEAAADALDGLGIRFAAIDPEVAAAAGRVWWDHRRRGGIRERMLADFVIGTHAWMRSDRLLTRDRGFYREYFKRLRVVDPSAG